MKEARECFNEAAALRPQKANMKMTVADPYGERFNEAAALRPQKGKLRGTGAGIGIGASMRLRH